MKAAPLLLISVGLAAGSSVLTTYALRPASPAILEEGDEPTWEVDELRTEVARLSSELEVLRVARLELPAATSGARISANAIDEAVSRYFEELGSGLEAATTPAAAKLEAPSLDIDQALAQLHGGDLNQEQRIALWKQITKAGKLEEVIEWFEQFAEENSNDPDAQVEVASAYLQKIFEVGDGPEAGLWANKADAAYDRALALDSEHWDARFSKAVSLSFWPPIFGKQSEAISQFETLIKKQAGGSMEDRHAQTYLLLGNLYTQTGQQDKAKAIWSQGLGLFPNDESLLGKFQ